MSAGEEPSPASPEAPGHDREVEATGETVGEAKWTALHELEKRFPGLDKTNVRFAVLSEGERGLLGVGYEPARVVARVEHLPAAAAAAEAPGSLPARLRDLLERVTAAVGAPCSIVIAEDDETLTATLSGPRIGLVIGKRGQTIDAIQHLAGAILFREAATREERKEVVVDAGGYRARRRGSLERIADRAAQEALATGQPVVLEPMTASERKVVHVHLKEREEIETASEGEEPARHVVVRPVR